MYFWAFTLFFVVVCFFLLILGFNYNRDNNSTLACFKQKNKKFKENIFSYQ